MLEDGLGGERCASDCFLSWTKKVGGPRSKLIYMGMLIKERGR